MSTRRVVKLSAGEAVTLAVGAASVVTGKYGQDVQLDGRTLAGEDVSVFVKLDTAQRQFNRIGIGSVPEAVEKALTVSKVAKDGKVYTNIHLAKTNGAAAVQKTADPYGTAQGGSPLHPAAPATADQRLTSLFTLYDTCFAHALKVTTRVQERHSIPVDPAAIAATIFIQASKAGITQ